MKRTALVLILAAASFGVFAAGAPPAVNPHADAQGHGKAATETQFPREATVVSVIDVPKYTYLEVAQNKSTYWIATRTVTAKKGDVVRFADGLRMRNFHSATLNRDFPMVLFVSRVEVMKGKQ